MAETWKAIDGFPGYEVSDCGRVRHGDRILRQFIYNRYPAVTLCRTGTERTRRIHHLVLEAFVGPKPSGMEGLHGDDDKRNNALGNLSWGTHQTNCEQRTANGRTARGERNGMAKLNVEAVIDIRRNCLKRGDSIALAKKYGVSRGVIRSVLHRSWQHVAVEDGK